MRRRWWGEPAVVVGLLVLYVALAVNSYRGESATWDEPQHVAAGYTALRLGDYRLDPEHPPLLRMYAALPLLAFHGIDVATNSVAWRHLSPWEYCHEFMYQRNNADALLYAARAMIVALGVLLAVLLYCWAREWQGARVAAVVLALYVFEPNLMAHARLVTTDFGVTCFVFGALYFLWRLWRRLSWGNLAGEVVFFALALTSKFSALLLIPLVGLLLAWRAGLRRPWPALAGRTLETFGTRAWAAARVFLLLLLAAYVTLWAAYRFRYEPTPGLGFSRIVSQAGERAPGLARAVAWIDAHRLLPNACSQGFLLGQAKSRLRSCYLLGRFSETGWWYYFPLAFLWKTPVGLLILGAIGVGVIAWRWRQSWGDALFVLAPIVVFAGVPLTIHLNIGLRHILPIYPFVLLLAGAAAGELLRQNRRWLVAALVGMTALETALLYPHYLAFFNVLAGGPRHADQYLLDSNVDWGQDLKGLKVWMDRAGVRAINLSYFGTADPAYYGIASVALPGAPFFLGDQVRAPVLPGFVAVSLTNLRGVYLGEAGRAFYRPLLTAEPVAQIGYSINIYRVERPWWNLTAGVTP